MFADYRIPQVFLYFKAFRYSDSLLKKLQSGLSPRHFIYERQILRFTESQLFAPVACELCSALRTGSRLILISTFRLHLPRNEGFAAFLLETSRRAVLTLTTFFQTSYWRTGAEKRWRFAVARSMWSKECVTRCDEYSRTRSRFCKPRRPKRLRST